MIIHTPHLHTDADDISVSAKIKFENANGAIPEALRVTFPRKYGNAISNNANGFLVALLPLAMYLGEDVHVRGNISGHLAYNLKEFQRILTFWHPEFSVVDIRVDGQAGESERKGNATMAAFSGGVDSFFTLFSHLPQSETNKTYQISHALFVEGFDRPLEARDTFRTLQESYDQLMDSLGIEFIVANTNVRDFYMRESTENPEWDLCAYTILAGLALMLDGEVSRFYLPADEALPPHFDSHDFNYTFVLDYLTSPLLSSDTLETIYHGASTQRIEKIRVLSEWSETYDRLLVCWESHNGLHNCGTCEKCIRTMTGLDIFDSLHAYKTFPAILKKNMIRNCKIKKDLFFYHEWNSKYALAANRKDLVRAIHYALFRNTCVHTYADWKERLLKWALN